MELKKHIMISAHEDIPNITKPFFPVNLTDRIYIYIYTYNVYMFLHFLKAHKQDAKGNQWKSMEDKANGRRIQSAKEIKGTWEEQERKMKGRERKHEKETKGIQNYT